MTRAIIFLTGGAILALQLIASRILAPFFGVSLYIWTGILAITLLCLAIGYGGGGQFTRRASRPALVFAFYLLPAISGIAIALSAMTYPVLFGPLARFDLLLGSFVAAAVLLAVPLTALSALNPILVAMERTTLSGTGADAGAGRVFFVSTIGSVAGVLAAAFYMIPNWSNIESIAQIAGLLGGLAVVGCAASPGLAFSQRVWIAGTAGLAIIGSIVVLFVWAGGGTGRMAMDGNGRTFSIVASYPSPFGGIKVADVGGSDEHRLLLNDGVSQNRIYRDGRSRSPFTYVLEAGALHLRPDADRALVLGLGAGTVPLALARRGIRVDVVEINPRMVEVAASHFGFTELPNVSSRIADARTFVRECSGLYDLVFVDLFVGDGMPDHLAAREFLRDVRRCLAPGGAVAINSFLDTEFPAPYRAFLATVTDVFDVLAIMYIPQGSTSTNGFLFATHSGQDVMRLLGVSIDMSPIPLALRPVVEDTLATVEILDRRSSLVANQPVLTDDNNRLSVLATPAQRAYRHRILHLIPDILLIN